MDLGYPRRPHLRAVFLQILEANGGVKKPPPRQEAAATPAGPFRVFNELKTAQNLPYGIGMRIPSRTLTAVNPLRSPAHTAIARGTAPAAGRTSPSKAPATPTSPFATLVASSTAAPASAAAAASATPTAAGATVPKAASGPLTASVTPVSVQPTGIAALVNAIMSGSLRPTNVTDPSKLAEITPRGTFEMPSIYYASDDTASQIAQLLGGTVVRKPAFGQAPGSTEPLANFIELPNGMTVNAADLAYYAKCGNEGVQQLTADLTQEINQGAAVSAYYDNPSSPMPAFQLGEVGPAISGMTYPAGTLAANGSVINPAMQANKP